jgi:hypothetical protein
MVDLMKRVDATLSLARQSTVLDIADEQRPRPHAARGRPYLEPIGRGYGGPNSAVQADKAVAARVVQQWDGLRTGVDMQEGLAGWQVKTRRSVAIGLAAGHRSPSYESPPARLPPPQPSTARQLVLAASAAAAQDQRHRSSPSVAGMVQRSEDLPPLTRARSVEVEVDQAELGFVRRPSGGRCLQPLALAAQPAHVDRLGFLHQALVREAVEQVDATQAAVALGPIPPHESTLDRDAHAWIVRHGLGHIEGLLGALGSSVEDFEELTQRDLLALHVCS